MLADPAYRAAMLANHRLPIERPYADIGPELGWSPDELNRFLGAPSDPRRWSRNAAAPHGWLKDVGIGLHLGSVRSGLGNVLHVDLAFSLDRGGNIDSVLIETRKSF